VERTREFRYVGPPKASTVRSIGAVCGYLAAVVNIIAFVWYGHGVLAGTVETNPLSWWMWLTETGVGLAIYIDRTRDLSKWSAEAVSMVGVTAVAGYLTVMAFIGHAKTVLISVAPVDYGATVAAAGAFVIWLSTRERHGAGIAILVFQIALVAAAFPLIRAAHANPLAEPFGPWALWTVAYGLQLLCAGLRLDGPGALWNPLNYTLTHGAVAWIVWQGAAL